MLGSWVINITKGKFPQSVASSLNLLDSLVGAEYTPLAYVGFQEVNGINHAVLAEQLIIAGKDQKNIVLVIFHEGTDGTMTISSIERVVEGGAELGGIKVDVKDPVPYDAKAAFDASFQNFVGVNVTPVMQVAMQVTKGIDYILVAEMSAVAPNAEKRAVLVTVNALTQAIRYRDFVTNRQGVSPLGYAFTW